MAVRNVPEICPATLQVNMSLAAGIGALQGDASRYGAFRLAVDATQDRTLTALDPRECTNKIYPSPTNPNKYGVQLVYPLPDCTPLADNCDEFDCTLGETATPTTATQNFEISECAGFNVSISMEEWEDTCCGTEEYHTQIADLMAMGNPMKPRLQGLINQAMQNIGTFDRGYNLSLITRKIADSLNRPVTGELWKINDKILDALNDGAGYNFAKDFVTGDAIGDGDWELPVLYNLGGPDCPLAGKAIDAAVFRLEMIRFVRNHPNCASGITLVGGSKFEEMFDQLGILACCDSNGVNKDAELRSALGTITRLYIDDRIDEKFEPGTFFIVENNSIAFFWLTLWNDPRYRTSSWAMVNGKKVERIAGYRDFSTTTAIVGNCRDGNFPLTFDTFFNTKQNLDCFENSVFNFQFRAKFGIWTRPAVGCDSLNPMTGIYKGKLVDKC